MFIFDFCLIFHKQIRTLLSITEKIKDCSASDAELSSRSNSKDSKNIKNKHNRHALKRIFQGHEGAINCLVCVDDKLYTGKSFNINNQNSPIRLVQFLL